MQSFLFSHVPDHRRGPTPWDYMWNADTELFEGQHRAAVDGSVVWVEASEEDLAGFPALTDYKLSFLGWDYHWWY